jgi:hypothetical protein
VPRTGVPGKADTLLVRVPLAVACIDDYEEVALGVVSFKGYDPVLAVDVGDLAVGGAKAGVVQRRLSMTMPAWGNRCRFRSRAS